MAMDGIVLGNGSNDVLELAARSFLAPGLSAVYSEHAFAVYPLAVQAVGAQGIAVPARDYGHDLAAMARAVRADTRLVFIANPNNPTGTLASRADIARLHSGLPPHVLFVLDQAYAEYLEDDEDDHGLALAASAPNVFITRTFSKIHGLAAERIGWGYASAEVIAALHRIRAPFNVTSCGQKAAIAAINDDDFVNLSRRHNRIWREWLAGELEGLGNHGLRVIPSACNFLLVLFEGRISAETVYKGLMEAGYIVRWLPGQGLPHGLRITIGTEAETRGVAAAIRALLDAG